MTAEPELLGPDADGPLAEEVLAQRYALPLRAFAARRLGDPHAAEEVAQETFRRALEALRSGRIRDRRALPSFLFQTARHVCLHRLRAGDRQGRALERLAGAAPAAAGEGADPLAALVSEERRRAVARALAGLAPADRDLLRALFHDEERAEELARRMAITPGALRVRKHRALGRLRQSLAAGDVTSEHLREPQNG